MRHAGGWEACWLGGPTAELVAALDRWWLTRAAVVWLCSGLLCSLTWWTGGSSRDVQELAIAVKSHWSIGVRRVVLLMMVQEGAIRRLRDGAAMEVLVLQVQREGRSTERLFNRLKARSCWNTVDVRWIVFGHEVRRRG